MTNRQKTILHRWTFLTIIISRLLFLIPEYFPNILQEWAINHTWMSLQIHFASQIIPLVINHQFIDPLILGLIVWLVGFTFMSSNKGAKFVSILLLLPTYLFITWIIFYHANGNTFAYITLKFVNNLGNIFKYGVICISIGGAFIFMILGIIRFIEVDYENERLRIKYQDKQIND